MSDQEKSLHNPMAQLALLYQKIEARLRRCLMPDGEPITMAQLLEDPDVIKAMHNADQVRHAVNKMMKSNFIIKIGTFNNAKYKWRAEAGPFTLQTKLAQNAAKAPSEVKHTKTIQPSREIELVMDDIKIIVGKNPETGRVRIVIE